MLSLNTRPQRRANTSQIEHKVRRIIRDASAQINGAYKARVKLV